MTRVSVKKCERDACDASGYLDVPKFILFLLKFRIEHQNMQMAFFFCACMSDNTALDSVFFASSFLLFGNLNSLNFRPHSKSAYKSDKQSARKKKRIKRMTYRILIIAVYTHIGFFRVFLSSSFFITGRNNQIGRAFSNQMDQI